MYYYFIGIYIIYYNKYWFYYIPIPYITLYYVIINISNTDDLLFLQY